MTTAFLTADIRRDEGQRLNAAGLHVAYPDPKSGGAPWTIDFGHTGPEVRPGLTKSTADCVATLERDIAKAAALCDAHLPWWRGLCDARQDVLVNMMFNMGWLSADAKHGLGTFHNTLAAMQAKDWQAAHDGMLASQWAKDTGARARRLAAQMLTGVRAAQPGDIPMPDPAADTTSSKSPLQSTTIQGAILSIFGALIPTFANMLGVDAGQVQDVVGAAVTIVGFAMTIIGRMKATKAIK